MSKDVKALDGFVYILKIPLIIEVEVENDETSTPSDSFTVVQVGMVDGDWAALSRRLYQHMRAWHTATAILMNGGFPSNGNSDCKSVKQLSKINTRATNFPDLIGLLPRYEDESDDVADTEDFVRDLVGCKLRRRALKQLLSHSYDKFAGETAWKKGGGDLSSTELRVISGKELDAIRDCFVKQWGKNLEVSLSEFVDYIISLPPKHLERFTVYMTADYTSTPASKIRKSKKPNSDTHMVEEKDILMALYI